MRGNRSGALSPPAAVRSTADQRTVRRVELGRIAVGAGGAGALTVGRIEPRRRRIAYCVVD